MGHKTHPYGFRLGIIKDWKTHWYANNARDYSKLLLEDIKLRESINGEYQGFSDAGIASCFDAKTGSRHWMKRMGRRYSASLVTAGEWVYFLSDYGITTVIKPGKTYEEIAINALEEHCFASPAISQGQLFVRGEQHLYCIGTHQQTSVDTCDTDALD